jgi:predicted peroxiredoxin
MAKLFITTLVGAADPTRASIPFHLATNGAAKNGVDTTVGLMADASELLKPGVVETIRGVGVPPLKDLWDGCRAAGIRFYV